MKQDAELLRWRFVLNKMIWFLFHIKLRERMWGWTYVVNPSIEMKLFNSKRPVELLQTFGLYFIFNVKHGKTLYMISEFFIRISKLFFMVKHCIVNNLFRCNLFLNVSLFSSVRESKDNKVEILFINAKYFSFPKGCSLIPFTSLELLYKRGPKTLKWYYFINICHFPATCMKSSIKYFIWICLGSDSWNVFLWCINARKNHVRFYRYIGIE